MIRKSLLLISAAALAVAGCQSMGAGLETAPGIMPVAENVAIERVTYRGREALRVRDLTIRGTEDRMVMLPVRDFHNGVIEGLIAGAPQEGVMELARGFVGIAFRVQDDPSRYEAFYIRPTNGRADDQFRRNHSTQYISHPDFTWHRLREENPGVYESYADMVPGEWTKFRIEVEGDKARFYLNNNPQPALIVNDLKLGADARGGIALWIANATDAHFANVTVTAGD